MRELVPLRARAASVVAICVTSLIALSPSRAEAQSANRAIRLNGVDAFGTAAGVGGLVANSTWEAWIRLPQNPTVAPGLRPVVFRWGGNSHGLDIDVTSGQAAVSMYSCPHTCPSAYSPVGSLQSGQWHHVAMVFGPGASPAGEVYIDGQLAAWCGPQLCVPQAGWETVLGAAGFIGYTNFFQGDIDELRISNVVRYAGPFVPQHRFTPDANTVGLWHFDEGQGNVAFDSSGTGRHFTLQGGYGWVVGNLVIGPLSQASGPQAGGEPLSAPTSGFALGPVVVRMGGAVTAGTIASESGGLVATWTSPTAAAPGITSVRFTQGDLDVVKPAAYEYKAPQIASATPSSGAWYVDNLLSIPGANLAFHLPVSVSIGNDPPIPATFANPQSVRVAVPAGTVQGAGPLDIYVHQAGITAKRVDGWTSLPSLSIGVTGSLQTGGVVEFRVESAQSGLAVILVSPFPAAAPIHLPGFHAPALLDPVLAIDLGAGGLLTQPTKALPFPPNVLAPGVQLPCQALVFELGALGEFLSFTNRATLALP
jgi:hypothetical protein